MIPYSKLFKHFAFLLFCIGSLHNTRYRWLNFIGFFHHWLEISIKRTFSNHIHEISVQREHSIKLSQLLILFASVVNFMFLYHSDTVSAYCRYLMSKILEWEQSRKWGKRWRIVSERNSLQIKHLKNYSTSISMYF